LPLNYYFVKISLSTLSVSICLFSFLIFLNPCQIYGQFTKDDTFLFVIDPGHGGKDPGTQGFGAKEKDLALSISLKIGKLLQKESDIKIIYTRTSDRFVELYRRARIANDAQADFFLSVHCDAFRNPNTRGTHAFVIGNHVAERNYEVAKKENSVVFLEDGFQENYPGFDPRKPETLISLSLMQNDYLESSIRAAKFIHDRVEYDLRRPVRDIKQAGFIVLHQTFMPSVLLETGFLSNSTDARFLKSQAGQNQIARAVADALIDYKNWVQSNVYGENVSDVSNIANESLNETSEAVMYRVQIMATDKALNSYSPIFKELSPIIKEPYKNLYRYYYGFTKSLKDAQRLKSEAIRRGFKGSVVVEFRDGVRIDPWN